MSRARGFTIVELITVVVLLGILSMVAVSRMVKPSAFAPGMVAQAIVAEARIAQQRAASRGDALVTLTVDQLGSDWRLVLSTDVDGVLRTQLLEVGNTAVQAQSGGAAATLDSATALRVDFDAEGNLATVLIGGVAGQPTTGVAMTINGDSDRDVCIYPTGYATQAACA